MIGWETIGAMTFILLALLAPVFVTLRALGAEIKTLGAGGKDLTDYQKETIEQITRLEEQVRSLSVEGAANKLLRDEQHKDTNAKIDREIHGQGETREKAYQSLQVALDKLDVKFARATEESRTALALIVALQSKMDILMKERDAATALNDSSRRKEHTQS